MVVKKSVAKSGLASALIFVMCWAAQVRIDAAFIISSLSFITLLACILLIELAAWAWD